MRSPIGLRILFAAIAAMVASAHAVTVAPPPPNGDATAYSEVLLGQNGPYFVDTVNTAVGANLSEQTLGDASLHGSTTMTLGTSPAVSATTSRDGYASSGTTTLTQLIYYVMVTGPTQQVTIDFASSGDTSATGVGATATAEVGFQGVGLASACTAADARFNCGAYSSSFTVDQSFTVITDRWIPVSIYATASVGNYGNPLEPTNDSTQSASAWVDPAFTIDAGQANGQDYSFTFSPQLAAVPEPAPMSLMFFGLAALWAASRRRS